ncbi:MAG: cyclase family protein [Planctomycetota bacterium]|nr:MAG: cyclase family protein [Planctomycetota bacterium]
MTRALLVALALAGGVAFSAGIDALEQPSAAGQAPLEPDAAVDSPQPAAPPSATPTLADLAAGKLKLVDLAWPLNDKSAYWPGENYQPFELHTIATLEKDGVLSKTFSSPEHLGTHLDAPNHFERGKPSVDQIPAEDLFSHAVVIDVRGPVSADADYLVSLDDVRRFEREHGRIPQHAVVLANTGWSKFWKNSTRYQNRDVRGRLHFPGFSPEAVKFLIDKREVRGVGLDTLSVDRGISRDFPVHHLLGQAECYGLENLAHLDELPPAGFYLFVAPIKIETGSGGPARVFAAWAPSDATGGDGS